MLKLDGRRHRRLVAWAVLFIPLGFFLLFYFYPLAAITRLGLAPEGRPDLGALLELFQSAHLLRVLWFTTWQAAVSTALTLLLAFPGAYVLARYRFPGKVLVRALATLPFVLPTIVVAAAFMNLLGPQGIINSRLMDWFQFQTPPLRLSQTVWLILLAHVFYNYSVSLRLLTVYWQNMSSSLTEAAMMLGASPWRAFREIALPMLWPAIMAAAVLVFIFCFTSFGVIVILGGPRFATLEVEIYRQAINLFNLRLAAALSLWQIVFTFFMMWFYTRTQARLSRPTRSPGIQTMERPVRTTRDRALVTGTVAGILLFIGGPLVSLVARSLRGATGPTLAYYRALFANREGSLFFVPPFEAIANSLAIAVAATFLSVVLGLISAQLLMRGNSRRGAHTAASPGTRILEPLLTLPLATSAVALGLGYLVSLARPPFALRSSILLLPIAHAVVAMPFVLRSILPGYRAILPSLREAAATMGAGEWRVWREVDWPLIRRPLLVGALFAFTISMGEFGATVFLVRPQTPTMPVAIYRFLSQPGALNYGQALAMSVLLMFVCAVAFVSMERFRVDNASEW